MAEVEERFIDADEMVNADGMTTYEGIVIRQIQECVKVLSQEMTIRLTTDKNNSMDKIARDTREEVINHVDTLKMLMSPFLESDYLKLIQAVYDDIDNYKKQLGERKIRVVGRGIVKANDVNLFDQMHPLVNEFKMYKATKYRDLFEILVKSFHKYKRDIMMDEIE